MIHFLGGLTLVFPASLLVEGAEFPAKPIQILIGYAPGGSPDRTVRALANEASKLLGNRFFAAISRGRRVRWSWAGSRGRGRTGTPFSALPPIRYAGFLINRGSLTTP